MDSGPQGGAPDWAALRAALWERCGGRCEVSGLPLDREGFDAHHRRNRGMGGTRRADAHSLANLLALDPAVHNGGPLSVHGRRSWSEERGYLVPKHVQHPGMWPVLLHDGRQVLLGGDGRYHPRPSLTARPRRTV